MLSESLAAAWLPALLGTVLVQKREDICPSLCTQEFLGADWNLARAS